MTGLGAAASGAGTFSSATLDKQRGTARGREGATTRRHKAAARIYHWRGFLFALGLHGRCRPSSPSSPFPSAWACAGCWSYFTSPRAARALHPPPIPPRLLVMRLNPFSLLAYPSQQWHMFVIVAINMVNQYALMILAIMLYNHKPTWLALTACVAHSLVLLPLPAARVCVLRLRCMFGMCGCVVTWRLGVLLCSVCTFL